MVSTWPMFGSTPRPSTTLSTNERGNSVSSTGGIRRPRIHCHVGDAGNVNVHHDSQRRMVFTGTLATGVMQRIPESNTCMQARMTTASR